MSEKGYSSNLIGRQWIETVFDAQTENIANGCKRLLIVDGHSSHFTWELLEYADSHGIAVLCLPPHTTHALQSMYCDFLSHLSTDLVIVQPWMYWVSPSSRGDMPKSLMIGQETLMAS